MLETLNKLNKFLLLKNKLNTLNFNLKIYLKKNYI